MLISAREACRILAEAGVSRRCALQVLGSGLAGEAVHGRSTALYDDTHVLALARRRRITWRDVHPLCPEGLFVSRRQFPAAGSREEQLAALSGGWGDVSPWTWLNVVWQIRARGSLPFVATLGGLVVCGADIVGIRRGSELLLERPGPWFEAIDGCWFPTGRGRPWVLSVQRPTPEKIAG